MVLDNPLGHSGHNRGPHLTLITWTPKFQAQLCPDCQAGPILGFREHGAYSSMLPLAACLWLGSSPK